MSHRCSQSLAKAFVKVGTGVGSGKWEGGDWSGKWEGGDWSGKWEGGDWSGKLEGGDWSGKWEGGDWSGKWEVGRWRLEWEVGSGKVGTGVGSGPARGGLQNNIQARCNHMVTQMQSYGHAASDGHISVIRWSHNYNHMVTHLYSEWSQL